MTCRFVRFLLLAPLLLSGCDVVLTLFAVPVQASPGAVATISIAGNIAGSTGEAGCVLQLPNAWTIQGVTNNQNWVVVRDSAALLAMYVAEPGHYLAAFSGTGTASSPHYLSQITLTIAVAVPANALGPYALKVSLAGSAQTGVWQIAEPAGVAQFAAITAAPYARPIFVGVPPAVDYVPDGNGLPPDQTAVAWAGMAFGDVDGDGKDDLAAVQPIGPIGSNATHCWLSRPGATWIERSTGLPTVTSNAYVAFGHLDNDAFLDLVDGNGHVCFGDGGTSWTLGAPLPLTAVQPYASVAVGDVDGDGLDDIAIGAPGVLQVLLNNGNR